MPYPPAEPLLEHLNDSEAFGHAENLREHPKSSRSKTRRLNQTDPPNEQTAHELEVNRIEKKKKGTRCARPRAQNTIGVHGNGVTVYAASGQRRIRLP